MKHFKSVLAMLLALVMILSCAGTAFAAEKVEATEISGKVDTNAENTAKEEAIKNVKDESLELDTYRYADDQIVRAIVILDGECEAEVAAKGEIGSVTQRRKLNSQHAKVFREMGDIDYELKYEYTRLLNGFSCDIAYGDLEAIAAIDGVSSVHIANSYAEPELTDGTSSETRMAYANYLMDNDYVSSYGYDGYGLVIAVLDTGITPDHEAFADFLGWAEEGGKLTKTYIEETETIADGVYLSGKIPFAYDYADGDTDVTDTQGHGTHVSGIAAGFAGYLTEEADDGYVVTFSGAAPSAQILSMKIFSDEGGGTTSDIYFYALEDAYTLGADVVNMSIGAQNGFTYDSTLETEVFGDIYQRLSDAGVILSVAAGNEYSMAYYSTSYEGYTGYVGPDYQDYGTVASPSTYTGNVSVASVENTMYPDYVVDIDGNKVSFNDSCDDGEHGWLATFGGTTQEYVVVKDASGGVSIGEAEDYANIDVTGKIAIVLRGDINFEDKVENAANAGAIGCIVVNNASGIIGMSIETFEIPAVSLQQSALDVLSDSGSLTTSTDMEYIENPNANLMSDFSNWGTSPMLTLDPAITGVGGMVYSSVPGGTDTYEVYSGTSMAAPNMTGTYANVLTAIYDANPDMAKEDAAELAKTLLYGSTYLVTDEDGYYYSPRKQGAGLASSYYAIENYTQSGYLANPLQELGDDPTKTGVYTMELEVKNNNNYELYYTELEAYVMYDYLYTDAYGSLVNTATSDYAYATGRDTNYATVTYEVGGAEVTEFTVPAESSVTVKVTIKLDDEIKEYFNDAFPNGNYVEGYVIFNEYYEAEDGGTYWGGSTSATFLTFYGDWTQGPVLEEADFMDIAEAEIWLNTTAADDDGNTYGDWGYTWSNSGLLNFYTIPKIAYLVNGSMSTAYAYAGDNMLDYVEYNPAHIAFSTPETNGSYNYAEVIYMQPYQLRNASHLIMTVTDKESGEVYYVDDTPYLSKSYYDDDAGWQSSGVFYWDGTDLEGNYVPSGTVATITYDAVLPYGNTEQKACWQFDVTVDYTAPVIESVVYDEDAQTLTVTASDDQYLQAIYLADSDYQIVAYEAFSSDKKGASFTATFDISDLDDELIVTALDYATNEIEQPLYTFETGLDATVTLNTPTGPEVIECHTGDTLTFTSAPMIEGYEFMFWVGEEVEEADDETVWYIAEPWFFVGDDLLVKETEYTLYALYAAVEEAPLDTPNYYYTTAEDYSGDWAIVGWNLDEDYQFLTNDPYALNSIGTATHVAEIEGAIIGDYYIEFFANDDGIRFSFEQVDVGVYTIKNIGTGKYLATNDDLAITYVDEVTENAKWYVSVAENGISTRVENVGVKNAVLLYDDEAQQFAIYDDSVPYYGEYAPSDWFYLPLYFCDDVQTNYLYYTTMVEVEESCMHENTKLVGAKDPTCTEEGYTGDVVCVDCDDIVEPGDVIPATGHAYVGGVCLNCGATDPTFVNPFTDVEEGIWYYEYIMTAFDKGLINGYTDGTFLPNGQLTRAEAVTILYRMAGSPIVETRSSFVDLVGEWYMDPIAWAQQNGIVNGMTETTFEPDTPVTREMFFTMLWRYAGKPEAKADLTTFEDNANVSFWAEDAIEWAVSFGLVNGTKFEGKPGLYIAPLDNIKRAEATKVLVLYAEAK